MFNGHQTVRIIDIQCNFFVLLPCLWIFGGMIPLFQFWKVYLWFFNCIWMLFSGWCCRLNREWFLSNFSLFSDSIHVSRILKSILIQIQWYLVAWTSKGKYKRSDQERVEVDKPFLFNQLYISWTFFISVM